MRQRLVGRPAESIGMLGRRGLTLAEVLVALFLMAISGLFVAAILPRMADGIHRARIRQRAGDLLAQYYMSMLNDRPKNQTHLSTATETYRLQHGAQTSVVVFAIRSEAKRDGKLDTYGVTVSWKEPGGARELKIEGKRFYP